MAKDDLTPTTQTCTCGTRCVCHSKHRIWYLLAGLVLLGLLLGSAFACGAKMGGHNRFDNDGPGFGRGGMMQQGFRDDMGGPRTMRTGLTSKVTAVSADSLTVTNDRTGGSTTYKLNDSTSITKADGTRAAATDIKTGDTVAVRANGTDTTIATSVALQ